MSCQSVTFHFTQSDNSLPEFKLINSLYLRSRSECTYFLFVRVGSFVMVSRSSVQLNTSVLIGTLSVLHLQSFKVKSAHKLDSKLSVTAMCFDFLRSFLLKYIICLSVG